MQVKSKSHESHSFNVNAASILSIEKALILREIYRTCQYRAKNNLLQFGLPFCHYSAKGLADQFPYMKPKSINRWMVELEDDGYVFSTVSNKMKIDRTKSYLVNFEMYDKLTEGERLGESHANEWKKSISQKMTMVAQNENSISQNEKWMAQNEPAITPSVNPLSEKNPQPLSGELQSLLSAPATAQTHKRLPVTWEAVLRLRATPALDGTVSPAEDGDIWERRMFVFDAVRRKYPGTKAGLLQEFNGFLKKCWKDKLELDTELSRMLYAILYQIKWKEAKNQAEEFSAAWKNFSTWINQAYWQSDMDSWKNKSEWFHTLCSAETKQEVERIKSILVCK